LPLDAMDKINAKVSKGKADPGGLKGKQFT
jgi:hypothetical protein